MKVIDCHVHHGTSLFGTTFTEQQLLASMDRLGIQLSVLCPVKPVDYHFGPEHDRLAATIRRNDGRFIGCARIDPWQGKAGQAEFRRCIEELGFRCLFLHPLEENFQVNDDIVCPLVDIAGENSLPVMLVAGHNRVSRAFQVADLVRRFPTVTFIVTSGGQINISGGGLAEAEELFVEHDNVMFETSGVYRLDFIEDMTRRIGPERVMFGSGAPVFDQDFEMKRILFAHLPDRDKDMLLGLNAADSFERGPSER